MQGPAVKWELNWKVYTGSMPKAVELTPDGSEAWVTNFGNDRGSNLTVFDAATGEKKRSISFSGRAVELAFSPDGSRAFVSNFDQGALLAIDTVTGKIEASVKVGVNPKIVTVSPAGDRIYVSNWSSHDVSVIDADSFTNIGRIKTGANPRGSDIDIGGERLFVANFHGGDLSVLDLAEKKEIKRIELKSLPRHVILTPDGSKVLVSCMAVAASAVAMVDPDKLEVTAWIDTGSGPKTIVVSPGSRLAFTADYFGDSVSILDLESVKTIATIPDLGDAPCGLALSADGRTLYVTSWYSRELRAIGLEYPEGY